MTPVDRFGLRLLGHPVVEGLGDAGAGVLSQPKRLAILAFLAVQGEWVRRDVLVEMFWPDSDAERARKALSQATHTLRRALGRTAIRSRGNEELGISHDHVWIDVRAFEAAVSAGRWVEAVDLHRAELLQGLTGDQVTAEFARWLEAERLRFQTAAAGAAKRLSDEAFRAGDVPEAISWARRAVAVRPLDETVFRDYLALLDESGDAALAISEYESFRTRLGNEFDLEPARETVRLIEMVRGRRPEAASAKPAARPVVSSGAQHADPIPARGRTFPRRPAFLAALGLVAIIATWLVTASPGTARPPVISNRIAVIPFHAVGDGPDAGFLAEGITGALMDQLSAYNELEISPAADVARFRDRMPPIDSLVWALNAALYVTGNVRQRENEVHVGVHVTDADGKSLANEELSFQGTDVSTISERVMESVLARIALIGHAVELRTIRAGTRDSLAAEYVIRAWETERNALEEHMPHGLEVLPGVLARADSTYAAAIERDRRWARPWVNRGKLAITRVQTAFFLNAPWEEILNDGIEYASTAIDLEPENPAGYELRAQIRWQAWVFGMTSDTATLGAAVDDARTAMVVAESRPRPEAYRVLSNILMERGNWEEAFDAALAALSRDEFKRDLSRNLEILFESSFNLLRDSVARGYCDQLQEISARSYRALYCELQLMAWSPDAEADVESASILVGDFLDALGKQEESKSAAQAQLLLTMVQARVASGRPAAEAAVASRIDEIVTRYPSVPDALYYGAAAMARLGHDAEARRYLQRYMQAGPGTRRFATLGRWFPEYSFDQGILAPEERGSSGNNR